MISFETQTEIVDLFQEVKNFDDKYDPDCDASEEEVVAFLKKLAVKARGIYLKAKHEKDHISEEDLKILNVLNGPGSPFEGLIDMPKIKDRE